MTTAALPDITDEYMQARLSKSKAYTAVLLLMTEKAADPESERLIWEHGRRNFALQEAGKLSLVCPATDESDWAGICVFEATPDEVDEIMQADPGVEAGVFTYELHPVMGFGLDQSSKNA